MIRMRGSIGRPQIEYMGRIAEKTGESLFTATQVLDICSNFGVCPEKRYLKKKIEVIGLHYPDKNDPAYESVKSLTLIPYSTFLKFIAQEFKSVDEERLKRTILYFDFPQIKEFGLKSQKRYIIKPAKPVTTAI